jgi:Na+/H+-dicarboxylate symporter
MHNNHLNNNLSPKTSIGRYIFIALILGMILGEFAYRGINNPDIIKAIAEYCTIGANLFLRLIKMVIAPLIFSTIVTGIAKMGDKSALGRVFLKSMLVFILGGLVALILGVVLAEIFQPGKALNETLRATAAAALTDSSATVCTKCQITLNNFIEQIIPSSSLQGFVENHMLQVIIIALFFGIGGIALGDPFKPVFDYIELFTQLMFLWVRYIMYLAPLAVFAAIVKVVMSSGISVIKIYLVYVLEFYLGLIIIWLLWIALNYLLVGRLVFAVIKENLPLYATAFAASTSESALPGIIANFPKLGISRKIGAFVVPLGYAFNLEGSMLNCTYATLFIIQLYGFHISWTTELTMLLMLMITSKGIAGIPRASLVVIAATLTAFGYPESGILILLPVDGFNDMGRSATSAFANTMSAVVVDKWEKIHRHE